MLPDKNRRIVTVALRAAAPYGYALGGSSALLFHGVTSIGTKSIDLVTNKTTGQDAAHTVETALRRDGFQPERLDQTAELANVLPPTVGRLAQWRIPTVGDHHHPPRDGFDRYTCEKCYQRAYLELSKAPRSRDPLITDVGPVLHVEDAAGQKVCALASRARIRDYAHTADLLERWSPAELIGFARRLDTRLDSADFVHAAQRLDQLPEVAFTSLGVLRPQEVPRLRQRFADWPRAARDIDRHQREHVDLDRDMGNSAGSRHERPEPSQRASQSRDPADGCQPQLTERARQEPGNDTRATARPVPVRILGRQPDVDNWRAASQRRRERETERHDPEIER